MNVALTSLDGLPSETVALILAVGFVLGTFPVYRLPHAVLHTGGICAAAESAGAATGELPHFASANRAAGAVRADGRAVQYEARRPRIRFETGQIASTASKQAGVTAALKTVSKVSRIFRDTIHLPCFTSSMLGAYC